MNSTMNDKQNVFMMRSAFVLFKNNGIEAVKRSFPEFEKFCLDNKDKTIDEITEELQKKLDH